MTNYIPADKLKADIDKKWKELADKNVKVDGGKYDIEISTYLSIKNLITSLHPEQPEVDLEKEFNDFLDNVEGVPRMWHSDEQIEWAKEIARHFYELGLSARKED